MRVSGFELLADLLAPGRLRGRESRGQFRFGLFCLGLQPGDGFFRLLGSGFKRLRCGFELLCVCATLGECLPRKPLRELASELFQLRSQPAGQLCSPHFCRSGLRLLRLLVGFLLQLFDRARGFIGDFCASGGKLLFPLLEGEAALGGNGMGGGFLRGGLNLLPRVGDEPCDLACQLERRVGGARGGREDAQVVACARRCVRRGKLGLPDGCRHLGL